MATVKTLSKKIDLSMSSGRTISPKPEITGIWLRFSLRAINRQRFATIGAFIYQASNSIHHRQSLERRFFVPVAWSDRPITYADPAESRPVRKEEQDVKPPPTDS